MVKLTRKKVQRKRAQRGGGLNEEEQEEILYRISELRDGKINTKNENNLTAIRDVVAGGHFNDLDALDYVVDKLDIVNQEINNQEITNYIIYLNRIILDLHNKAAARQQAGRGTRRNLMSCGPPPVFGRFPGEYCGWKKGGALVGNGIPGEREFPYYCGDDASWLSEINMPCDNPAAGGRRRRGRKTTGRSRKTTGRSRKTTGRSRKTTGRKTRSDKKH
jgi:hypothetical protein